MGTLTGGLGVALSRFFGHGSRLVNESLGTVLQPQCLVCERAAGAASLCPECQPAIPLELPQCGTCGDVLIQAMEKCGACSQRRRHPLRQVKSLFWFSDGAREILHKVKYSGRFELLELFRTPFEEQFEVFFPPAAVVIPVPLHPSRLRERGFNQSELLGEWVSQALRQPLERNGLRKEKATVSQSSLARDARYRNLRSSFTWNQSVVAPPVALLVDDIYTTGATLEVCARTLRKAGCREVFAWTLCRTPRIGARG